MNIFNEVDTFFSSLKNYLNYNIIFIIFGSLFLFTVLVVIISTSRAYEARLIKAIDMFNSYFIDNPQITDENLVAFNNKMKSRKVPKQLRKQWQQFVLYREDKASHYMSFDICVSTPIKNSSYKRDITVMNILTYIYVFACILLNLYFSYEFSQDLDLILVLQRVLLCPILILLLNYIVTIFLDLRHNAIVSDLYQNYQYFEVNIDKATQTLPEYVDYEVLFDRNEIKKGIPILYAYLQKRAEEEKKELERARLKNVEHEKFNFDEAGVESSLVLERAMQEAENYIAERKKYMQDMEQINSDITQEEMNFREITKEYQRQMQVSKESFDNFKTQLEDVSSTIEANYLKKQQQQELDRQRNLERDYDTATDRHKKLLENYQTELTSVENAIKDARKTLEKGMMSEFDTYSGKVYDAAMKAVEEREKENKDKLKQEIKNLEETIVSKDKELDNIYKQNQALSEKLDQHEQVNNQYQPSYDNQQASYPQYDQQTNNQFVDNNQNYQDNVQFNYIDQVQNDENDLEQTNNVEPDYNQDINTQQNDTDYVDENSVTSEQSESYDTDVDNTVQADNQNENYDTTGEENSIVSSENVFTVQDNESKPAKKAGRPRKVVDESEQAPKEVKRRGRPRKEKQEETPKVAKKRGRPRKEQTSSIASDNIQSENLEEKTSQTEQKKVAKRGRPKKIVETENVASEPKKRGRPRKENTQNVAVEKPVKVAKRGRPKKDVTTNSNTSNTKKKVGRPRKEANAKINADSAEQSSKVQGKKRGRPRKVEATANGGEQISDIDAYLKEIDDQIAKESAKIEETKKELEKNSRISNKKK